MSVRKGDQRETHPDPEIGSNPSAGPGRRRRRRADRGLPADEALRDLARTYLQSQRALWPELVDSGLIPPTSTDAIAVWPRDFASDSWVVRSSFTTLSLANPMWDALAGSYLRYSDQNSNPRSLDQQLHLQLERAKQHAHFIPWEFVFADAAVTGTTADRNGYDLAKQALRMDGLRFFTSTRLVGPAEMLLRLFASVALSNNMASD